MDEWEIREDERKKIREDAIEHEMRGGGWNINVIQTILKKRGELASPIKCISKLDRWYASTANTESSTYENIRQCYMKINELVEAVNELNSVIRTVKA